MNRLPLGFLEESKATGVVGEELGDRSIAIGSPFSAPLISCTNNSHLLGWFHHEIIRSSYYYLLVQININSLN